MHCIKNVFTNWVSGKTLRRQAHIAALQPSSHVCIYAPLCFSCGAHFSSYCIIRVEGEIVS